jgi:hypothetical protein
MADSHEAHFQPATDPSQPVFIEKFYEADFFTADSQLKLSKPDEVQFVIQFSRSVRHQAQNVHPTGH